MVQADGDSAKYVIAAHRDRHISEVSRSIAKLSIDSATPAVRRARGRYAARMAPGGVHGLEMESARHKCRGWDVDRISGPELSTPSGAPAVCRSVRGDRAGVVLPRRDGLESMTSRDGDWCGSVHGATPELAIVVRAPTVSCAGGRYTAGVVPPSADLFECKSA